MDFHCVHKAPFGNRMRNFDARFSPTTGYLSALLRLLYWQLLAVIAQRYVPLEFLALQTGGDKVPWCILISFVCYTRKLYLALLREAERGYGLQTPGRRHRPLNKTLQYYHSSCIFFRNKATLLVWQRSCIYILQMIEVKSLQNSNLIPQGFAQAVIPQCRDARLLPRDQRQGLLTILIFLGMLRRYRYIVLCYKLENMYIRRKKGQLWRYNNWRDGRRVTRETDWLPVEQ